MADPREFVEVKEAGATAALARLPAALHRRMAAAFQVHGQEFDRAMQVRNRKGGGGTQRRSGRLVGSVRFDVKGSNLSDLTFRTYSAGVSYARMQEYGGTVRAKAPRRYLAIPVLDNLTGGGSVRYPSAADLRSTQPGKSFVFKSKDGRLFIGLRSSTKAKMKVLFRLKEQVTIPPRFGFQETWDSLAEKRRARHEKAVKGAVKDAVSSALGGI